MCYGKEGGQVGGCVGQDAIGGSHAHDHAFML